MKRVRILLTNDDGVQSPGLAAMRDALIAANVATLSVAPDGPRSGNSRSATFRRPIVHTLYGGDEVHPIHATDGTPVDCVRVAMLSSIASDCRLVISGINEGANLGDDATYSSTLGAAIEGALLGLPAISVSQQSRDGRFRLVDLTGYDFAPGAQITAGLARLMLDNPPPARTVINVNAPAKITNRRIAITHLDRRQWEPGSLRPVATDKGNGWLSFGTNLDTDPVFEGRAGSDVAALLAGQVSMTPLSFAWGDPQTERKLRRWLRDAIEVLETDHAPFGARGHQ